VRGALEVTTPDRIVFGSDWPYAALPAQGGDPAPELDELGASVRAQVDGANAAALVPRLAAAAGDAMRG
jgi:predicted TIM-barrel fold metal-dependent hydrolase